MERHFHILGAEVTLSAPARVLEPIAYAYRRFETEGSRSADAVRVRVALTASGSLEVDGRCSSVVDGLDPAVQLYQRFQASLMDAVDRWALLHAAALGDGRGGVFLLAGPSGHGKSSLTLELARRGHRFFSDDIAPLSLTESLVSPFPRAVGVLPGVGAPIPEPFADRACDPAGVHWLGKTLLDVGEVLGESAVSARPAPLRRVFLLVAGDDPFRPATEITLAVRAADAEATESLFESTKGVHVTQRRATPALHAWRVRLDHDLRPSGELADFLDGDRVLLFEKRWDEAPDFSRAPEAGPARRREAAELLAREMLNRRRGGRLLAGFAGGATEIFFDLAGALSEIECWRVRVGDCRQTADLIESLVGGEAPRRKCGERPRSSRR